GSRSSGRTSSIRCIRSNSVSSFPTFPRLTPCSTAGPTKRLEFSGALSVNVLAIGAHFDDVELGCGGTLAKHKANGDRVFIYIATQSGYRAPDQSVVRDNDVARREGEQAVRILGADELICGPFKTFEVEFVEALNTEILGIVERTKTDIVYTHWIGDIHHDHQVVAKASL